ncbi:alpha/beta fold hydrolase [Janibacter melonis]|uniref:Alpha/beta fold hydrolase n=1 Tax=Janibacter melonis TaxID=262209 RepID=A0A650GFG2_9MICO|nr:alpha/beta hydrolase [Janibacter melonis]QGX08725.1 alpha/beta fold hydrolase [Janibacter melonis]
MASRRTKTALGASLGAGVIAAGAGAIAARRGHGPVRTSHPDGTHPWGFTPGRVESVLATDGTVLHVEVDEPKGATRRGRPTVVLVHGFTIDLTTWAHQRRRLVLEGYRVVTYDQRNHGLSGQGDLSDCTIEQLGRDLRSVLEAVVPSGPVVLVGHSMGGMTIMSLAQQQPALVEERVRAVGLVSTSAGGGGLVSVGFGPLLDGLVVRLGPGLLRRLGSRDGVWGGLRRVGRDAERTAVQRYGFGERADDETLSYFSDVIFSTPLATIAAFLPQLDELDVRDALPGLARTEVLVLGGSRDQLTPPSHSEAIVDLVPRSMHVVVPGAGHLLPMERPDVVTSELLALVERGVAARARSGRSAAGAEVRDTGSGVGASA